MPSATAAPAAVAYELRLRPDFAARSVSGAETIVLRRAGAAWGRLSWPLHELRLTDLRLEGQVLPFDPAADRLELEIPAALAKRTELRLRLRYAGRPREGLVWGPGYVHTSWGSCHWMICDEAPAPKARLALELLLPAGMTGAGPGAAQPPATPIEGQVLLRWRQDRAEPSYVYGFAAGRFHAASAQAEGRELRYLGIDDDAAALARKFRDTPRVLAFFAAKAGVPLPDAQYTQVLVPGGIAQEASSLALIGKKMLDPIEQDETEDWVIVHELAHQWWGNLITSKTWPHFWLNEGLTVFMTAAYKEHRWGAAAYARELGLARQRHQTAIDAGWERPLARTGDYPNLGLRRAIQYSKGALFFDALRRELGDAAFWRGLRHYTRRHAGGSVESADLQRAFEAATGRDLGALFARWVY